MIQNFNWYLFVHVKKPSNKLSQKHKNNYDF